MSNQLPVSFSIAHEDYGQRLSALRKVRGLSQRELARQAGMTNGSLSQIESSNVSPSVGTLEKLLNVLNVSLSDFFSGSYSLTGQVFSSQNYTCIKTETDEHRVLSASLRQGSYRYLEAKTLAPGEGGVFDWPREPLHVLGLVVKGQLKIAIGKHDYLLNAHDGFNFSTGTQHYFSNVGQNSVEFVAFFAD